MNRSDLDSLRRRVDRMIARLDAGATADELLDECAVLLRAAWRSLGKGRLR